MVEYTKPVAASSAVGTAGPAPKQGQAQPKVNPADVGEQRKLVNTKMENIEDLQDFLQRISQELKNAQTAAYPPTVNKVADEIDAYVRKLGYEPKDEKGLTESQRRELQKNQK